MLVCTAISPKANPSSLLLVQAPSHSRLCELAQICRACLFDPTPHILEDFDIATNPLLLQDRQALVSLPQLCLFLTLLYSLNMKTLMHVSLPTRQICITCCIQAYVLCSFAPNNPQDTL